MLTPYNFGVVLLMKLLTILVVYYVCMFTLFFSLTSAFNWFIELSSILATLGMKQILHFVTMILLYIQVIKSVIKYRWNALPAEQRDKMKNFISDVIVQVRATSVKCRDHN